MYPSEESVSLDRLLRSFAFRRSAPSHYTLSSHTRSIHDTLTYNIYCDCMCLFRSLVHFSITSLRPTAQSRPLFPRNVDTGCHATPFSAIFPFVSPSVALQGSVVVCVIYRVDTRIPDAFLWSWTGLVARSCGQADMILLLVAYHAAR